MDAWEAGFGCVVVGQKCVGCRKRSGWNTEIYPSTKQHHQLLSIEPPYPPPARLTRASQASVDKRQARLDEMERMRKWNVDTICHVAEERTILGKDKDKYTEAELPPDLAAAQVTKRPSD